MINHDETFLTFLNKEFDKRKKNNSSYSIRAFARDLGVDQSLLSKFLRGKTELNWKTIEQCLGSLRASKEIVEHFEEVKLKFSGSFSELEDDIINAMGSWKYWAILEYFKINPVATSTIIAERFCFEVKEVESIISNLLKLEFIEFVNGKCKLLRPNNNWVSNSKTTEARKNMQKNLMNLSLASIDQIPVEYRHHCSLTISVDKKRIDEMKGRINALLEDLGSMAQKSGRPDEVYQFTLGFFPLTHLENL